MGANQSCIQREKDLLEKDAISGIPHAVLTFVLDMIFPRWAVRIFVDNTMWYKREHFLFRELMARDMAKLGISITRQVCSGSSVEGIGLPNMYIWHDGRNAEAESSDYDTLLIDKSRHLALTEDHATEIGCNLVAEFEDTHPGFVTIRILDTNKESKNRMKVRDRNGVEKYYLSPEVRWDVKDQLVPSQGEIVQTGPALTQDKLHSLTQSGITSTLVSSVDHVYAIRCNKWPDIAKQFLTRHRPSGWPSKQTLDFIANNGLHVVGVPHKLSTDPDIEWRLSYSAPEVYLASTLSLEQRQVYILLKYISKAFLKGKPGFFSYLIKTVFFWTCEEIPINFWNLSKLSVCLLAILDKLIMFLAEGHVPNYFIPQANLVGHLTPGEIQELSEAVVDVRKDPLKVISAQRYMRLPFHAFAFEEILGMTLPLVLQVDYRMFQMAGFRCSLKFVESVIMGHANLIGKQMSGGFYGPTHIIESFLRQFWMSTIHKIPTALEVAHKRRELLERFCDNEKFTVSDHVDIYRESACRVDEREGFSLKERKNEWDPLGEQILKKYIELLPMKTDILSKIIKPQDDIDSKELKNIDDLPLKIYKPVKSELYEAVENPEQQIAVMDACQGLWKLVQGESMKKNCEKCSDKSLREGIDLLKGALESAPHDPCVVAEYLNMLLSFKITDSAVKTHANIGNNISDGVAQMYENHVKPTVKKIRGSRVQITKTFSKLEAPMLESNIASVITELSQTVKIPYEIYMLFLYEVLAAKSRMSVRSSDGVIILSKAIEANASSANEGNIMTMMAGLSNNSSEKSFLHFLKGTVFLYEKQYVSALSEFHQANSLFANSEQYKFYKHMTTALLMWEMLLYNEMQCKAVVTLSAREKEESARNWKLLKQGDCHCQNSCYDSGTMKTLLKLCKEDSPEAHAIRRLFTEYHLGSDMDEVTYCKAYVDLFLLMLPQLINLWQTSMADGMSNRQYVELDLD